MSKIQWQVTALEDHAAWWELVPFIGFIVGLLKEREGLYILSIEQVDGSQKKKCCRTHSRTRAISWRMATG